jgi:hypothetical protein
MQPKTASRRSVIFSFRFLGTALIGSLVMALVCTFGPPPAQLAILGALLSILAGLFLSYLEQEDERDRRRSDMLQRLATPLTLAPEHDLYDHYVALCQALIQLATRMEPILREIAALKLAAVGREITALADGTVVFSGTEAWRTVYDKLLQSADIREYQSVAWVRSKDYWQDLPGQQSIQANFSAVKRGLLIERTVILPDEFWPVDQTLPNGDVRPWIENQHNHGLWVALVRESQLVAEQDLLDDFGIYGERAFGRQEFDERCRTKRFVLSFDPHAVQLARDRWKRLTLFATPYRQLLDRAEKGE